MIIIIDLTQIITIIIECIESINNYQRTNPYRELGPYSVEPFVPEAILAACPLLEFPRRAYYFA